MLVPNLRPKVVPHEPRLLPGLIVRTRGGLVAGAPSLLCAQEEARPSGPALRPRGHHPGHPRAVAPLQKRARLLALRHTCVPTSRTCAPRASSTAGYEPWSLSSARYAAGFRRGALRAFGRLPSFGYDPHPGRGPSEGFSQGAVCRAGELREERLQDLKWVYGFKVALVVDPKGVGYAPSSWPPPRSGP